jgi:hypothetical protein
MNSKHIMIWIIIASLMVVNSGCQQQVFTQTPIDLDHQGFNSSIENSGLYSSSLKGSKHDKECTYCHTQQNFKPECIQCHERSHNAQFQDCKECHDAHAPLNIAASSLFNDSCYKCHTQQNEEFVQHPSRHADLKCIYCHQEHRHIEACINCHAPHSMELTVDDCLNCHPAHMPLQIDYPEYVPNVNCASCHERTVVTLEHSSTKHNTLTCTYCHPVHEMIPECIECHKAHTSQMTNDECMDCHPAHNPVVIDFPASTKNGYCAVCHKDVDSTLSKSDTKHAGLGCVYCHPKHRYLPTCESCHGLPHKEIHDNFPLCSQCHIVSHDVKNIIFTK